MRWGAGTRCWDRALHTQNELLGNQCEFTKESKPARGCTVPWRGGHGEHPPRMGDPQLMGVGVRYHPHSGVVQSIPKFPSPGAEAKVGLLLCFAPHPQFGYLLNTNRRKKKTQLFSCI